MAATELSGPVRARRTAGRPSSLWGAWAHAYALLCAFTLATALVTLTVPGAGALARGLLHLKLNPSANPPPSMAGLVSIATNNILRSSWPLVLGPLGAARNRVTRTLADGAVLANLLVPGLLVGGALGGYGLRVLAYVPHVPVEWAGVAVGGGGWLGARSREQHGGRWRSPVMPLTILLAFAAAAETFLVPHR